MADHWGPLTDKQKAQLEQFKLNIKDVLKPEYDNEYLLRWIRAREWDLKKAEQMLRASLEWRKKNGCDTIMKDYTPPELFTKYFPGNYLGVDKQGRPIWWELLGVIDIRGVVFSATKKDIVRYRMYKTEELYTKLFPEQTKKTGKRIDKVAFIVDLANISLKVLWKPAIDVYTELLSMYEAHYPETLGQCYVINEPPYLPILYNVVKPFLAEYTRSKIMFLGKNWKQVLLEHIDADQLPVHYGGTRVGPDGDPQCKSLLCYGGPVPESLYTKNRTVDVDMTQFTTINVSRATSTKLEFQVDEPGSMLSWNFWTNDNDIGFGVYRRTGNERQKKEDMDEIVDNCRVNSHLVPECGTVLCDKAGTYIVRFDNTYSWLSSKKVSYLIQVLAPDKELEKQVTNF